MAVGAMFPFARGHSETGTIDHEPWSFGEEVCLHSPSIISCSIVLEFLIYINVFLC